MNLFFKTSDIHGELQLKHTWNCTSCNCIQLCTSYIYIYISIYTLLYISLYIKWFSYVTTKSCHLDSIVPYRDVKTRFSSAPFFVTVAPFGGERMSSSNYAPSVRSMRGNSKVIKRWMFLAPHILLYSFRNIFSRILLCFQLTAFARSEWSNGRRAELLTSIIWDVVEN